MITKSIRWRLQLWLFFLLASILSGFAITAYEVHRRNQLSQIDEELASRLALVIAEIRPGPRSGPRPGRGPFEREGMKGPGEDGFRFPPKPWEFGGEGPPPPHHGPGQDGMRPEFKGPHGPPDSWLERRELRFSARTLSRFDESDTNAFYFAIWSRSGRPMRTTTNAPPDVALPTRMGADPTTHTRMRDTSREIYQFTEIGECVLIGRVITTQLRTMRQFGWWLAGAGGAVLALGLGGGWLLVTSAIRPVRDIGEAATRISAGNLSERINVSETDSELGRLAGVLNSTFARLEAAFSQQRQFTADASHELRTPLSVIISEAQTALAHERSAGEYRETVEACLSAAQQMRRLTQSLLQLARYDAGEEAMDRSPFDLAAQTRACVELVRPLAAKRRIRTHCELNPAWTCGDPDRLGQVVVNLLTNAMDYNKDEGEVWVSTRLEGELALLEVVDTGQGISPEDLPHIFERFYRGDKSRASGQSRNGLGLAICKSIVDAHGGSIEATSQRGIGTTFTVKLPAATPAGESAGLVV